jgi:hypothetical protein
VHSLDNSVEHGYPSPHFKGQEANRRPLIKDVDYALLNTASMESFAGNNNDISQSEMHLMGNTAGLTQSNNMKVAGLTSDSYLLQ